MKQNSVAFRTEAVNSFETMGQTNFPTRCNKAKCYLIDTYRGRLKIVRRNLLHFMMGIKILNCLKYFICRKFTYDCEV